MLTYLFTYLFALLFAWEIMCMMDNDLLRTSAVVEELTKPGWARTVLMVVVRGGPILFGVLTVVCFLLGI